LAKQEKLDSNSLANQLSKTHLPTRIYVIDLILAKQEKLDSNSLANQLSKTHLPTRIYAHAYGAFHRCFPVGWRVKKEIKNKEGFLM
jgi:lambda repressor-like predicted transcriptional regulator